MSEIGLDQPKQKQDYRENLAKELKELPKNKRKLKFHEETQSTEYKQASIYKIEDRYRKFLGKKFQNWEQHNIIIDIDKHPTGFQGATGNYNFVEFSSILLDSIVEDENGVKFFVSTKKPEEQSLASLIGDYLSRKDPSLLRLHFPQIRLEQINKEVVALVEYFEGYKELTHKYEQRTKELNFFTDEEKAFLQVYNLWIGNWDFKFDHVLFKEGNKGQANGGSIGLIDLEMSFDFDNPKRLKETLRKSIFLEENIPEEKENKYIEIIKNLDVKDRNSIIKQAVESGFEPEKTISVLFQLLERRNIVKSELDDLKRKIDFDKRI